MLTVKNGKTVILTRGDTAYLLINLKDPTGGKFLLQNGDIVRAHVRTKPNNGTLILSSESGELIYGESDVLWRLTPEDTKNLRVGTYYWDAELETGDGDVFTFIPCSKFIIDREVTYDE